jgi:DNA-directed RNA polymerase subunit alpha
LRISQWWSDTPIDDAVLRHQLLIPIVDLDLSVRANNCLERARVKMLFDLVRLTDEDLLKIRAFGKRTLQEVKRKLAGLGLCLGMNVKDCLEYPPPVVERRTGTTTTEPSVST